MSEHRLEVRPGARVMAADGVCGRVEELLADPHTGRVEALVVDSGLMSHGPVMVPFKYVRDSCDDEVRLNVSCAQLISLPRYQPEASTVHLDEQEARVVGSAGTGAGLGLERQLTVWSGQRVRCPDGYAGRMTRLLLDPAGSPRHLVVRTTGIAGREVVVPVAWVSRINPMVVQLDARCQELKRLPKYRSDRDIYRDVQRALHDDEAGRRIGLDVLTTRVLDGNVVLHGHVLDSADKRRIERAVCEVDGVLAVENHLVADDELVTLVAQALAREKHLRGQTVSVSAHYGVIILHGHVLTPAARSGAEMRATSVPWVRGVSNYLRVPGGTLEPDQRVLQPRPGQTVHATDMRLGRVDEVIIDPSSRRVVSMVVAGQFPNTASAKPGMRRYELPLQKRRVVVPAVSIDRVVTTGVMLNVDAIASAQYEDVDTTRYVTPPPDWRPPYPYRSTELRLTGDPPRFRLKPTKVEDGPREMA